MTLITKNKVYFSLVVLASIAYSIALALEYNPAYPLYWGLVWVVSGSFAFDMVRELKNALRQSKARK